jgi:hypothetical protein
VKVDVKVGATAAVVAFALASSVLAAGEPPTAAGDARLGTLHVTSGILVFPASADLRGGWQDTKVGCSATRRLTVRVDVYYRAFGKEGSHRRRTGTFRIANCAEGGPNVGYTLTARQIGYACANGRWKPGRLDFVVRTSEPTHGLTATASLSWANTTRC